MSSAKESATEVWINTPTPIFDTLLKEDGKNYKDWNDETEKLYHSALEKLQKKYPNCNAYWANLDTSKPNALTPIQAGNYISHFNIIEQGEKVCELNEVFKDKDTPPAEPIRNFDDLVEYFKAPSPSEAEMMKLAREKGLIVGGFFKRSKKQTRRKQRKHRKTQKRRLIK